MLSRFNTKVLTPGLIAILVLVASFILPQYSKALPASAEMVCVEQAICYPTVSIVDESGIVIQPASAHVDLHARILSKIKVKALGRKDHADPTTNHLLQPSATITNTHSVTNWPCMTKPAYYLFLFRYTLF
jgi:hypothetical protein